MIPFFSQINPSDFGSQSLKYKLLLWDLFSFGVEPQVKISVKLSQVETLRQQETGGGGGVNMYPLYETVFLRLNRNEFQSSPFAFSLAWAAINFFLFFFVCFVLIFLRGGGVAVLPTLLWEGRGSPSLLPRISGSQFRS